MFDDRFEKTAFGKHFYSALCRDSFNQLLKIKVMKQFNINKGQDANLGAMVAVDQNQITVKDGCLEYNKEIFDNLSVWVQQIEQDFGAFTLSVSPLSTDRTSFDSLFTHQSDLYSPGLDKQMSLSFRAKSHPAIHLKWAHRNFNIMMRKIRADLIATSEMACLDFLVKGNKARFSSQLEADFTKQAITSFKFGFLDRSERFGALISCANIGTGLQLKSLSVLGTIQPKDKFKINSEDSGANETYAQVVYRFDWDRILQQSKGICGLIYWYRAEWKFGGRKINQHAKRFRIVLDTEGMINTAISRTLLNNRLFTTLNLSFNMAALKSHQQFSNVFKFGLDFDITL